MRVPAQWDSRWFALAWDEFTRRIRSGEGTPEGAIAAPVGTLYLRTDGGTGTTLYVKETGGSTSTGWTAK